MRLLMTLVKNKPLAVLYRPVTPGKPPEMAYEVVSPAGREMIEEVRQLQAVELSIRNEEEGYSLEAALPLKELDFEPAPGERYRFDWGILTTDEHAHTVTGRYYWANQATKIISDEPSEVRLMPHLWGDLLVYEFSKSAASDLHSLSELDERKSDAVDAADAEKELEDMQE